MKYTFFQVSNALAHLTWFTLIMFLFLSRNEHIDHRRRLGESWFTYNATDNSVSIHADTMHFDDTSLSSGPVTSPLRQSHEKAKLHGMHKHFDFRLKALSPERHNEIEHSLTPDQLMRVFWLMNWQFGRMGIETTWESPIAKLDVQSVNVKGNSHVHGILSASAIDVVTIEHP
jgi:hypothetical protein